MTEPAPAPQHRRLLWCLPGEGTTHSMVRDLMLCMPCLQYKQQLTAWAWHAQFQGTMPATRLVNLSRC